MVPSRLTNGTGHREGSTSCGKAGISSSETMFQGSSIHHQAALPLGRRLRRRLGRARDVRGNVRRSGNRHAAITSQPAPTLFNEGPLAKESRLSLCRKGK